MEEKDLFSMADRLKELKDNKKNLDAQSKQLGAEIEELELSLSDAMATAEVDKFSRNGNTFYLTSRLFASPNAGMKDDMISALRKNGYGELVTETVNANTLASFCKELMAENGDELPEWLAGTINTFEKTSVRIRKN